MSIYESTYSLPEDTREDNDMGLLVEDDCVIKGAWVTRGYDLSKSKIGIAYFYRSQVCRETGSMRSYVTFLDEENWNKNYPILREKGHKGIVAAYNLVKGIDNSSVFRKMSSEELGEFKDIIRLANRHWKIDLSADIFVKPIRK